MSGDNGDNSIVVVCPRPRRFIVVLGIADGNLVIGQGDGYFFAALRPGTPDSRLFHISNSRVGNKARVGGEG
jgi:hypothetical protein